MKLASMFITASVGYVRTKCKFSNKRARSMKLASMFITASAGYVRTKCKYTKLP